MSISAKPLTNFELETKIRVIIKELLEATSNKYEMAEAQTVVVQSANRRLWKVLFWVRGPHSAAVDRVQKPPKLDRKPEGNAGSA